VKCFDSENFSCEYRTIFQTHMTEEHTDCPRFHHTSEAPEAAGPRSLLSRRAAFIVKPWSYIPLRWISLAGALPHASITGDAASVATHMCEWGGVGGTGRNSVQPSCKIYARNSHFYCLLTAYSQGHVNRYGDNDSLSRQIWTKSTNIMVQSSSETSS
jgi:hypothetical protein